MSQADEFDVPGVAWRVCQRLSVREVELVSKTVSNGRTHYYCDDSRRHASQDLHASLDSAVALAIAKVDVQIAALQTNQAAEQVRGIEGDWNKHFVRLRRHRDALVARVSPT